MEALKHTPEYTRPIDKCAKPCGNTCERPDPCAKDPCPKDPCAKDPCAKDSCPKDSCPNPCARGYDLSYGWGWLGGLILWFIIFTILFWLIYYSLKPDFVMQDNSPQVDTSKVLLAAVITSLILVAVIWLIKVAIAWRGW